MGYPAARRLDLVEDLFGHQVADPYRWLEDPDSAETEAWSLAQDELVRSALDDLPGRSYLTRRLRDRDRVCRTIVLRLRFGDFVKATRSHTVRLPTDRTAVVLAVARGLLAGALPEISERGITLIGISLSQLGRADSVQPELPIDWDDGARLDTVLDAVRDRFGAASVARATHLGRDPGWSTPLLPEHE